MLDDALKDVYIHLQKSFQKVFAEVKWMDILSVFVYFLFLFVFLLVSSLYFIFYSGWSSENVKTFHTSYAIAVSLHVLVLNTTDLLPVWRCR